MLVMLVLLTRTGACANLGLQLDGLQVVGNPQTARVVRRALGRIELLATCEILVLGVVEQKVFHAQLLGELACVLYRGVVLLWWLMTIRLAL